MISICPWLKISLNPAPCRDTQAAWREQNGGLQTADFGSVLARAPCVSFTISILFPYCFHIISILFPYYFRMFLENTRTIWNKCGKIWNIWISWFPECGKIMEKIWKNVERYGIHKENMWNKYEQSLALGQATKHLQMPQYWVYCMFKPLMNPYS